MSNRVSRPTKDRLIETARELFLREGIPQTGINKVIATADVARMTLYNNFASKDDLIVAVFEREAALRRVAIQATQEDLEGRFDRVLALFVVAEDVASQKGFRGCAFINLAIEAAASDSALHALAKEHKAWITANIRAQLGEGMFSDPDSLAQQIAVLWDGGIVGAYVHQSDRPIHQARDAARTLMRVAAQ
ncbi:TetR/AcrR family transcriptional regulator [Roseovarius sp.]|uniref:TetR/AcrR family transcriptional regulator n=1 Tax=Roseovarius sp. TaxID=1486281 RepID=UPI0035639551